MPREKIRRFFRDPAVRGAVFLYGGAAFHFLYAVFRLLAGVFSEKKHLDLAALFYLSLGVNRLTLITAYRKREDAKRVRRALRYAGKLFFLTAGLVLLLLATVASGGGRGVYPTGAIFVSGAYALASAALAILELWYYKRLKSPLLSASRAVGLSAALLSAYTFLSDVLSAHPAVGERARLFLLLVLGAAIVFLHLFLALGFLRFGKKKSESR